MNVTSLFFVYKFILVTFINDICFNIRLIQICVFYFKWIAINNISFILNIYLVF